MGGWAGTPWNRLKERVRVRSSRIYEELPQPKEPLDLSPKTYESILKRYDDSRLEHFKTIFSWLLVAVRPLSTKELRIAIAISEKTCSLEELERDIPPEDCFRSLCPNLLLVNSTGHVQFAHRSVKDFLLDTNTKPRYRISVAEAHLQAALCCLRYLVLDDLDAGEIRDLISREQLGDRPFAPCELLLYASKNWFHHARMAPRDTRVFDSFSRLHRRRDSFSLWWALCRHNDNLLWRRNSIYTDTPLPSLFHVAVVLNIRYLVADTLSIGADINERDSLGFFSPRSPDSHGRITGGTVLHFEGISSDVIRYLISRGADMNIKNDDGDTPLHAALRRHDEQLCCDLLDFGGSAVDFSITDTSGKTTLSLAIDKGCKQIVAKLLENKRVGPAHLEIVQTAEGSYPLTVIEHAVFWGQEDLAKALLGNTRIVEAQRQVRCQHSDNENPTSLLMLAILQGWEEVAIRVMEIFPGDIEKQSDKDGRTLLHHAAMENWHDLLDRCLDRPNTPKFNKMDKNGNTALHYAAQYRNGYAARRLLDVGAQPNVPNHEGKTAIHVAAEEGSEPVLRLFLERRLASVGEVDNEQRTVIHYAATWDLRGIMELLLALDESDVSAKDRHGRNAAHMAAMFGCPTVLRLLLDQAAIDLNAPDHYGRTILHFAVESKSESCVMELISRPGLINHLNIPRSRNRSRAEEEIKKFLNPDARPRERRRSPRPPERTGGRESRPGWELVRYGQSD